MGLVVYEEGQGVLQQEVMAVEDFQTYFPVLLSTYSIDRVVLGEGTGHKKLKGFLQDQGLEVLMIPEEYSTLEARDLYWRENRASGLIRLLPRGLRTPPVPIDDYAARILLKRFLKIGKGKKE